MNVVLRPCYEKQLYGGILCQFSTHWDGCAHQNWVWKIPLKGSNIFFAKFKGHFIIYKGFQSYLKRGYQINTRMADTINAVARRGLFYWRGSSIRDFTVSWPCSWPRNLENGPYQWKPSKRERKSASAFLPWHIYKSHLKIAAILFYESHDSLILIK